MITIHSEPLFPTILGHPFSEMRHTLFAHLFSLHSMAKQIHYLHWLTCICLVLPFIVSRAMSNLSRFQYHDFFIPTFV